jgi:membrane-bound metal-dependent hydrolase YbcI (DUF457 family)
MRAAGHAAVGSLTGAIVSFVSFSVTEAGTPLVGEPVIPDTWLVDLLTSVYLQPSRAVLLVLYVIAGWIIGGAAAAWPDAIESSKRRGPNHRRFFHSWTVFLVLAGAGYLVFAGIIPVSHTIRWAILLPFIGGYLSHLFVDAFTAKGLPALN